MSREQLLMLLWAIFLAEGGIKASVPFGYIPLKAKWKEGKISFIQILKTVIRELQVEYIRWLNAVNSRQTDKDFVWWLAYKGYNANPKEASQWEKNVRLILDRLERMLS